MDAVNKLENTFGNLLKNFPHLPKGGREWLANNIWWIALISAIIGVLGILLLVPAALIAIVSILTGEINLTYNSIYYMFIIFMSFVSLMVTTVVTSLAIVSLRKKKKIGWSLIFISLALSFVLGVVTSVLQAVLMPTTYGLLSLVTSLIVSTVGFFVGAYFIFEIREYFGKVKKIAKKSSVKT